MKASLKKGLILCTLVAAIYLLSKMFFYHEILFVNKYQINTKKDLFRVVNQSWNGFIDINGKPIIKFANRFFINGDFNEGLASICKSEAAAKNDDTKKCGFINKKGEIIIPLEFTDAHSFNEGLAPVQIQDIFGTKSWGYINYDGKFVINPNYRTASGFHEGLATVSFDQGQGIINNKGETIINPNSTSEYTIKFSEFSEGLAKVSRNRFSKYYDGVSNIYGFINTKGDMVIPLKYYDALSFSEGVAKVSDGQKHGFIDKNDKLIIPLQFEEASSFKSGLASVYQGGKCGYIDKKGKLVIPIIYDFCESFSEGLAAVKIQANWGYINKNGEFIILPKFGLAFKFDGGIAGVCNPFKGLDKYFSFNSRLPDRCFYFNISYINHKGEYIFKSESDE